MGGFGGALAAPFTGGLSSLFNPIGGMSGGTFSDERLKEDIKPVGELYGGLFNSLGSAASTIYIERRSFGRRSPSS